MVRGWETRTEATGWDLSSTVADQKKCNALQQGVCRARQSPGPCRPVPPSPQETSGHLDRQAPPGIHITREHKGHLSLCLQQGESRKDRKAGTAQGSEEEDTAGGGVRKKQNVNQFFQKFAYDLKLPPLGHRRN